MGNGASKLTSSDAYIEHMRTTINIEDELLSMAQRLTGIYAHTRHNLPSFWKKDSSIRIRQ
jgi:hypothetical protein